MKKIISLLSMLLICISLSGCGLIKDDIYIVYTADTHAYLEEAMNFANVKAYVDSVKDEHRYVTLIDGGDFSQGNYVGDESNGSAIIELMNDTGYDYVVAGNHEFDYGLDAFVENIHNGKFTTLGCNISSNSSEYSFNDIKPYEIKSYGGTKVAYIGVLTSNTLNSGSDSEIALRDGDSYLVDFYGNPNDEEDNGERLVNYVQSVIDEVRSKVDYVVVISHLGTNDNRILSSYDLIKYTNGIDLVLDAHSHRSIENEQVENKDGTGVTLFAVGCHFEKIGVVKIGTDNSITGSFVNYDIKDVPLQNKIEKMLIQYD